jgi:hypothetical protein
MQKSSKNEPNLSFARKSVSNMIFLLKILDIDKWGDLDSEKVE